MTLIIALCCDDGVLMASDSQGTEQTGDPQTHVRREVDKIYPLTSRAVWGLAGFSQLGIDLQADLDDVSEAVEASPDLGLTLQSTFRPLLQRHYNSFVPLPDQTMRTGSSLLACGMTEAGERWIVELDQNCNKSDYAQFGFHAIGSGAPFGQLANGLLAHFDVTNKSLEHGKLIAFRVMDVDIHTSAYGVGGPIKMWVVNADGAQQIEQDELTAIEQGVGLWQSLEVEMLEKAVFGEEADGDGEDIPRPAEASLEVEDPEPE